MLDCPKKRISFCSSIEIILVERIENAWFTRKEFALIRRRDQEILKKVKRAEFKEGVYDSARGLSRNFCFARANPVVVAVLQEQKKQRNLGISDMDRIANVSRDYTKKDRAVALESGFRDEIEVNEKRPDDPPRISSARLIAIHESQRVLRSTPIKEQSLSAFMQREGKPMRRDIFSGIDATPLSGHRRIKKTPSLRKAFDKILSENRVEAESQVFEPKLHFARQQQFSKKARQATSVHWVASKRPFLDGDETTELTTASYSSIDFL